MSSHAIGAVLAIYAADLRRSPATALASVAAISAGVAIFVAIHLAGSAARSSFVSAVEAIAGRATHEVTAEGGMDEARLAAFLTSTSVEAAQPVVESLVSVRSPPGEAPAGAPPLRLLGIDPLLVGPFVDSSDEDPVVDREHFGEFLTRPGTIILPAPWARSMALGAGDSVAVAAAGRRVDLEVLAVYELEFLGEASRDTAVLDIATAQETLARIGRLDRIDLVVRPGREAEVERLLAPGERLQRPARRGERVARMVDAFRLNLLALGSLAWIVGSLLVYNASQFRVVRRAAMLGQLRCLGANRPLVLASVLAEVMLLGLLGGLAGLALGVLLAQWLAGSVAQTITDLYTFIRIDVAALDPLTAILVLVGAVVVSFAAGWFPALDAARSPPRMVGLRSAEEQNFLVQIPRLIVTAALAALAGALTLQLDIRHWVVGLAAAFAFLVCGAAALPPLMALLLPRLQRAAERSGWLASSIAAAAVHRSLSRTGGAAAALGVALAMTVGVTVMVSSFEEEVKRWIRGSLRADVYLADMSEKVARESARIPHGAIEELRAREEVRTVDTLRGLEIVFGEGSIFFAGVDLAPGGGRERFQLIEGDPVSAVDRALSGEVMISEPLSTHHDLHAGDRMIVRGREGEVELEIAGVFRDFSFDRGYAFTGKRRFVELFGDPGIRNAAVYLAEGEDADAFAESIRSQFAGRYMLQVRSNRSLRGDILEVFNRTFAVTYLLQLISTLLALAGITVTLFALFLERSREIATIRSIGATARQMGRIFGSESLLMASFPVVLAWPLGALLAWILIHVVNLRAFGWTITMHWPWEAVALTSGLALFAGLLATTLPVVLVRRMAIARALREE